MCGPASPMERRCRHDRSERWGTMQSGARLSRWHRGKQAPSGGCFCRPRCYAPFSPAHGQGCVVRRDRPPFPPQAHPVKAGRMISRSQPAVPALSPMRMVYGLFIHGPFLQAHGATTEIRPAGSPGGAFRVTGERASRHQVRRNRGARRHCGSAIRLHVS